MVHNAWAKKIIEKFLLFLSCFIFIFHDMFFEIFLFLKVRKSTLFGTGFKRKNGHLYSLVPSKVHLISKANCQAVNSSKKQTNEFIFTTVRCVFVHFLEEIEDTTNAFQN